MSEDLGFSNTTFKEKPDISMIFLRQLDRTNMAASRDYESSVIQKLNNLPMTYHKMVEDQSDRYTEEKETYIFEAPCGQEIGEIDDPCLKDDKVPVRRLLGEIDYEDPNIKEILNNGTEEEPDYEIILHDPSVPVKRHIGSIDWDDPNIWSPKMTIEQYIDYTRLDYVIMEASEIAGLTWNQDSETFKIATIRLPLSNKATPYRPQLDKQTKEDEEENDGNDQDQEEET